ncbi:MAG TPA: phosphate acyltransferase PlsX [Candidatus Limnocylindria bacterium]|nr:phosphate acyltransferase PlsX [Candidatus Limnocylindria bacterium]
MTRPIRIALDAMGGDHGPTVVVPGAEISLLRRPDTEFILFGDEAVLDPLVSGRPKLERAAKIIHTDVAIRMDDKPSQALRYGRRRSSMWLAIDAVRQGDADVAVSAGNTGALMAMAKICLKMQHGVDRPAIAGIWPTLRGESIVLDLGASIGADAAHLVDMAVMGAAMARIVFGHERPTVGLLNVGVEEMKGVEEVREAGRILRELNTADFEYHGFIEGDDLGRGTVDVVVTEGFAGNIALKTAEGTARQIGEYLRAAMRRTWRAQLGYLLARDAFRAVSEKVDPRKVNGGVFLGLNGLVVKSHGGTDAEGFASAIDIGYDVARHELVSRIAKAIGKSEDALPGIMADRAVS